MSDTKVMTELERVIAQAGRKSLTAGQTEPKNALVPVPADPSEPELVVKSFLEHRAASVKEEVAGNVILNQGIAACADDPERQKKLLQALVQAKVLSRAEADAGFKAKNKSITSMLKKIGQYAHVILHPKILPYLQPGYSVLYHVALLFETLEKNNGND